MLGEQAQLTRSTTTLALEPGGGQAGLLGADLGDRLGASLDLVGDGVEKCGAGLARSGPIAPGCLFRRLAGAVDQLDRAGGELVRRAMGG